jgi:hypothetical protein
MESSLFTNSEDNVGPAKTTASSMFKLNIGAKIPGINKPMAITLRANPICL